MIYLHTDKKYRPDQWYRRFEVLFKDRGLKYRKVDLRKRDYRSLKPEPGDALMGRFGQNPRERRVIAPIYDTLAARFHGRTFPRAETYAIYDDKKAQMELLFKGGYPTPRGAYVETPEDVDRFLKESGVTFPLVTKDVAGAGSANVALAQSREEVRLPGVVQEFCRDNDGDLRLNVIGNRVMGFLRGNRPGDFRASGSGLVSFPEELEPEAVDIAYRITRDHGYECMCYDFVRDNEGRWVVLEMSYAFVDKLVADCPYYLDMTTGERVTKNGVYPQDFILEDFLVRHPEVEEKARGEKPWFVFW